jgi:hypothetical protein
MAPEKPMACSILNASMVPVDATGEDGFANSCIFTG